MKTITKNEALNFIKNKIPEDFGKSWEELKKDILKTVELGSSNHFKSAKNGYSIFYTNNKNYMQGEKNGGGDGFFAQLHYTGFSKTIKII